MPNGHDKNWVRLCAALEGFRSAYGSWPTEVHLPEAYYENIASLFHPESFQKIKSKLTFVLDDQPFVAMDAEGRAYNYGKQGFPKERRDESAREWLGVLPDVSFPDEI